MRIFDEFNRSDAAPAANEESHADFLNRVHTPYWDEVRRLTEEWFSRFPADSQPDLRARLRARDNRQFYGAFWELYLHETLVRAEYSVVCHPELSGTTRRPDFLVEKSGALFVMEARNVSASDDEIASERRRSRIYDALNTLNSPNFFLWIGVEGEGNSPARTGPLRNQLERWLAQLDPDQIAGELDESGTGDELPVFEWKSGDWHLVFRAVPKSAEARGEPGIRPVGAFGPGQASLIDDVTPIRRALSDKGKAYGELDVPFVIALRTMSITGDLSDVVAALYGSTQVQYQVGAGARQMPVQYVRAPDGFWHGGTAWKHRNVPGVLVSQHLLPWTVAADTPILWEHPDPIHRVAAAPNWMRATAVDDRIEYIEPDVASSQLLGLPSPWPPGNPFEPYPQ